MTGSKLLTLGSHTLIAAALAALSVWAFAPAQSALARSKPKINFFAAPESQPAPVPSYSGNRTASPTDANSMIGATGESPRTDLIRSLPSLTNDQRKQLSAAFDDERKQTQPLSRKISTLQKLIRDRKNKKSSATAPDTATIAANRDTSVRPKTDDDETELASAFSTPEEMQAQVETLKGVVKEHSIELSRAIMSILSPEQLKELEAMRKGTLMIESDAPTDLPQPTPAKR